ncbi:MAG: T9SS type A sorting domain-containing protein [Bacteroidetes bacterium]|nr:T9SS type A sorting domain-containing protein [Bacteroidota bacterium]
MRLIPLKILAGVFFLLPILMSHLPVQQAEAEIAAFHSKAELDRFSYMFPDSLLPNQYNELFAASGTCDKCHGYDTAMVASVDPIGQDINVVDDWRSTMMANSARDPFWRAKVSHEVLVNPQHQEELEDKCTSCHAPLGHFNAKELGQPHYSMADLAFDTVALDGVSCLACHQQQPENLGDGHSGNLLFDTAQIAYGPYPGPLATPMALESGWVPLYGPHIQDAGVCAACHTLITSTVDLDGNYTGGSFVEQATYHEWLNSEYADDGISCQSCHMPQFSKAGVYLASGIETEPRSPFGLHDLVGANTLMLEILRDNAETLGVTALPEHFDETIAKTLNLLQSQSLQVELDYEASGSDSVDISVLLTNMAGHKFPSGYPARRLVVQFILENEETSDTLFASGLFDDSFEATGQNPDFEPHYDIIRDEEEVQIYELVMGDVDGNVTTVLERADHPIKDNRLTPKGFSLSDPVYDTTRIAGLALTDLNFNKDEEGVEGSGTDRLLYRLPVEYFYDDSRIQVRVYYQSAPPKWMEEMFSESSPEIDSFKDMFDAADRSPVLIRERTLSIPGTVSTQAVANRQKFRLSPNPASGFFQVEAETTFDLYLYSPKGKLIYRQSGESGLNHFDINLPPGVYFIYITDETNKGSTQRIIIQ